jgi:transposase InsO family protein
MRYTQSEKMEIIKIIEGSSLSVRRTLRELDISPSSFYSWYKRFIDDGYNGLANNHKTPKQFWNAIPEWEKERVVEEARKYPEKSCREIACHITDNLAYYISESSVYRILKAKNLVSSPVYTVISAKDKYENPTIRVNQLWQTDFTYFKIVHWGWYYLLTVLDDFSRYIIAWKLCKSMAADDVKDVLDMAIKRTGITHVSVYQRTRLLSDNGPCFISSSLRDYLKDNKMDHSRGKPYHPQTQGKIERYHRSMKNLILLDNYYSPEELEYQIKRWVEYYNNYRYHEAIDNVTPSDKYFGRDSDILRRRIILKKNTMILRRKLNRA